MNIILLMQAMMNIRQIVVCDLFVGVHPHFATSYYSSQEYKRDTKQRKRRAQQKAVTDWRLQPLDVFGADCRFRTGHLMITN
ncbi:hypothetical protein GJ699_13690 [Duganella sp. FT80W]|uniref:Uncharacterized protein n=1 Tax=Duganella guangzhouensis TaxID=2666084 RepID=A0A6I2KZH5_9BURK|nr:hypothetical protein [Duganella guangzhouensis]MRW91043.1 hypothetical protein [Duganella guangzhouensis]